MSACECPAICTRGIGVILGKPVGSITWKDKGGENTLTGDITRAVFLLSEDGQAVNRITMECEAVTCAYSISLTNSANHIFHGDYKKFEIESRKPVANGLISCKLLNATETHCLMLGMSSWFDYGWEYDWMVKLETVERVPYSEWNS
jgi:hypothetical protein